MTATASSESIVVAFRMAPSVIRRDPSAYLANARTLCARGEALGARLVAWSAAVFAMAFDLDSIEEAVALAVSVGESRSTGNALWAAGVAEGRLDPVFPDDARSHLSWGDALLASVSLARVAKTGEVLVDADLRAMRDGRLAVVEIRSATDSGRQVRGWSVDLDDPWTTDEAATQPEPLFGEAPRAPAERDFPIEELSTSEVLEIVDSDSRPRLPLRPGPGGATSGGVPGSTSRGLFAGLRPGKGLLPSAGGDSVGGASGAPSPRDAPGELTPPAAGGSTGFAREAAALARLARQVRAIALRRSRADALAALPALRRACADARDAAPDVRCRGALSLAVALAVGGLADDALLEALEALAQAREARDDQAAAACLALLSKLYRTAGWPDAALRLHELALERQTLVPSRAGASTLE